MSGFRSAQTAALNGLCPELKSQIERNILPQMFVPIIQGLLREAWVGSPTDIADRIEEWFSAPACDGFVVAPTHQPGCFEDFVKFVVPELQKRGIYRKDYSGSTLRDHLGLARPDIGAWKTNLDQ